MKKEKAAELQKQLEDKKDPAPEETQVASVFPPAPPLPDAASPLTTAGASNYAQFYEGAD